MDQLDQTVDLAHDLKEIEQMVENFKKKLDMIARQGHVCYKGGCMQRTKFKLKNPHEGDHGSTM